jgi:acyl carrier protein
MQKLIDLLHEVLECNADQLKGDTLFQNLESWDSMKYMILVMRLESEFSISLSPEEIQRLSSTNEVIKILKEKGIHE